MKKKKKYFLNRKKMRKNVVLAFTIAAVLICVNGIRYFAEIFFRSVFNVNEIFIYLMGFSVSIIILIFLIKGFSDDSK